LKKILRYRSLLLRRYCISIWEGLETEGLDGLLFVKSPFKEEGFRYLGPSYFSPLHDAVYVRRSGEDSGEDVDFTAFDRAIKGVGLSSTPPEVATITVSYTRSVMRA